MKKLILAFIVIFSAQSAFSQIQGDTTEDVDLYTKAERFADSSGTLIQKEYIRVGNIRDCVIQVVHYTDLIKGGKVSALRFVNSAGKQAYLDPDEVDVLAASMKIVSEKVLGTTPSIYTETHYISRSGFEAGSYFANKQWTSYLKIHRHDNNTYIAMKKVDFDIFLKILDNAKAKL